MHQAVHMEGGVLKEFGIPRIICTYSTMLTLSHSVVRSLPHSLNLTLSLSLSHSVALSHSYTHSHFHTHCAEYNTPQEPRVRPLLLSHCHRLLVSASLTIALLRTLSHSTATVSLYCLTATEMASTFPREELGNDAIPPLQRGKLERPVEQPLRSLRLHSPMCPQLSHGSEGSGHLRIGMVCR